ncbi:MAG: preprotein translocase subunit YajC [Planctomycetes bacterium]|nr:preprotein translocase subunit YajC [Planctomycetota bacterium]
MSSSPIGWVLAEAGASGAEATGGEGATAPRGLFDPSLILMFVLMYLVLYFLVLRPQRKQQSEHRKLLDELKKGDQVQTSAGIIGTVHSVDAERDRVVVVVDPSQNVKLTMVRSSIAAVIRDENAAAAEAAGKNKGNKNEKVENAS